VAILDALSPAQLIQPAGPLTTTLFPGRDVNGLESLVDGWLAVAYAHEDVVGVTDAAKQNKMARAYALYLAYMDVWQRMLAEPNAADVDDKGKTAYTDKQREGIKQLADMYLAQFLDLVPTAAAVTETPGTTTVPVRLQW